MIPKEGCDPEVNVVSIGAKLLDLLSHNRYTIEDLMSFSSSEFKVSIDHIILTLDWLFMINAIEFNGSEVFINETRYP